MVIDGESFVAGWIAGMLVASLLGMLFQRAFGDPRLIPENEDMIAKMSRQVLPKLGLCEVYELAIQFRKYPDPSLDDDDYDGDDDDGDVKPTKPSPRFSRN